jgi:metal-dependent amidase/aminoacylase/carboxypeptidase family protein
MAASLGSSSAFADSNIHILPEVNALYSEMVDARRWFHEHAELSFEEVETAARIASILRSYGYKNIVERVGRTGVVAILTGGGGAGPCIALRADMDALPIQETADIPYASKNKGMRLLCCVFSL